MEIRVHLSPQGTPVTLLGEEALQVEEPFFSGPRICSI